MAVCDHILNSVRSSNLNFAYQETPYSLYLTIRKTQIKNNHQANSFQLNGSARVVQDDRETFEKENIASKSRIRELEDKIKASCDATKTLEEKVTASEAETVKAFEKLKNLNETVRRKDDEDKCLKKSHQEQQTTILVPS